MAQARALLVTWPRRPMHRDLVELPLSLPRRRTAHLAPPTLP